MKIKKNNAVRCFVIVGLLLTIFGFRETARANTEIIDNFNVNITVQKNGFIFVAESIIYDFGSNQKHGIFRDIPLTSLNGPQLNIKILGVKNELGENYKYTNYIANNVLHIKIGNPNALISGIKTYIISYQVYNAIRTFSDHDELYWNVTGNEWPVAIKKANALVSLPETSIPNIRMDCFTGPQGSVQKKCIFNQNGVNINYSTTQFLNINEGFTIVLGIPLGYIHNTYVSPSKSYIPINTSNNDSEFPSLFISFAVFILVMLRLAISTKTAARKKPKPVIPKELKNQPVVVEYNPPDNLPPIEIGTLLDRRVNITDISSVIIGLAVRGYIKIRYTVRQIRFWPDKKDFELVKLKNGSDLVHPADKIIFELLFSSRDKVNLSDLKEQKITFQLDIEIIKKETEQHLHDEGYFDKVAKNRLKKLKIFSPFIGIVLPLLFFLTALNSYFFYFMLIYIMAVAITYIILARLNHKLTPQGISALAKILGFREFLQLTEKDKLELLNAPELRPEMFERFLPYAMVLGVEDKWAKKFEGIYNTIPNWYEDPTAASFNSFALAQNLNLFNDSFNQVFNITSPQSSGSGFGGGGSSGGGSGGGGGRSW